jgi:uncharacterized protein YjdB
MSEDKQTMSSSAGDHLVREIGALVLSLGLVTCLSACDSPSVSGRVAVTGVWLDKRVQSLVVGSASTTLFAAVTPWNATNRNVSWSSSDASVAVVSQSGEVTPVAQGVATITVFTQEGDFSDTCTVTVTKPVAVTGVSLDQEWVGLVAGSSTALLAAVLPNNATNRALTWSSSDSGVAVVSRGGEVTGLGPGQATITVTTDDGGFDDTCVVIVTSLIPVTGVSLDKETLHLLLTGPGQTLVATVLPSNASNPNVIWSSSDNSVAVVSRSGEVTPVAVGTATIKVTTQDSSLTDTCVVTVAERLDTVAWVLSYFGPKGDDDSDSLHLAYSTDGLHWRELNRGKPVYKLTGMGANQIRDPFILRKQDGTFVYIATDWTLYDGSGYWDHPSPYIVVAESDDLITFTDPRRLQVTDLPGPSGVPMHAWAPEAYWDPDRKKYAILFSGNDEENYNRIYVSYTSDFRTVDNSTPEVFFDPGYTAIDASIISANNHNYLFFKDESKKDIQIARSPAAALDPGSFVRWDSDFITRGTEQSVRRATEGPFVVKIPGEARWYMYADQYTLNGVFGCWTTTDLDVDPGLWTELSTGEFALPSGVRHANTVRVTGAELDALVDRYGQSWRVRTTLSDADGPLYFAHSWHHGMVTQLDDRTEGQLANDFYWRVVPGLANPSDPNLVSFEPVGFPGHYVRIDSKNVRRYPGCPNWANRGDSLCSLPGAERSHLVWIDEREDSETYRADATFRRVTALNGDSSMVSFQWYQDSARYLRPVSYQMFAYPVSSSEFADSSFALE